jgi:hypothetical protein
MLGQPWYERHDDDEYFDEIVIRTVPRWKTSGMSGDEWRVSAHVTIKRKGHTVYETGFNKIRAAAAFLPSLLLALFEREDVTRLPDALDHSLCFQPGCDKPAVSVYRLKHDYCQGGHKHDLHTETRLAFCQTHLERGDCGLKDADSNYEVVSGPGPEDADLTGATISESQRVEVHVNSIDEIPGVVAKVAKEFNAPTPGNE